MESSGHNQKSLSDLSGVPQPTLSRFLNGVHKTLRDEVWEKILPALGMTHVDFIAWEGIHATALRSAGSNLPSNIDQNHKIPLLSSIASMGDGEHLAYDGDQIMDSMPVSTNWIQQTLKVKPEYLRIITGAGDSMKPTFSHGDLLLVDISKKKVDVDGVYAMSAHQRLFIKRVRQRMDGSFEVSSDNPTVKTVDVLNGDHEVTIHGRVVWAWNGVKL